MTARALPNLLIPNGLVSSGLASSETPESNLRGSGLAAMPPRNAYGDATRALSSPREVEYQVFSQVTGMLNRALSDGRPFSEMVNALHENLRLWTVLTTDVIGGKNGLPLGLRGQLADLAKFIRGHTQKVLRHEAEAGVLVEINTAVMRGLRGQIAPDGAPVAQTSAQNSVADSMSGHVPTAADAATGRV